VVVVVMVEIFSDFSAQPGDDGIRYLIREFAECDGMQLRARGREGEADDLFGT
jgi:hypothetical protein